MKHHANLRHLSQFAASLLAAMSYASAQTTVNWEGDVSNLWAAGGNWDIAPTTSLTANIANFNLSSYGGLIFAPTVGTATSIAGITIGASNGTMTLTNTAALTIGGSGISIASGAGAFTISGSTTLGAAQSWLNNSANLLTFGAVTNGSFLLTIGGSGNTTASGIISGTGGLTKEGAGLLTLNAANTYTGATTVNGGELRWGITNAIAGGGLNINNGGTVNMQTFTDTVGTVTIAQGGTITGTTGTLTTGSFISNNGGTMTGATLQLGSITYNSTGPSSTTLQIDKLSVADTGTTTFDIADGDAAVDFDITGFVNNGGSNVSRTISKTGAGAMQFSGSTLGGAGQNGIFLNINEGTVLMNRATGVAYAPGSNHAITVGDSTGSAGTAILKIASTGGDNQLGTRPITINSDGLFDLNGKTQNTGNAVILNGTGQLQLNNGQLTASSLTLNPSDGNTTSLSLGASGILTLGGDVTLNASGTGRAQITGSALSLGVANRIFNVGLGAGADYDLLVGAGISGASRSLTKNGIGRLVLIGSNSYSGGTTVNAGTLQIGDGTTAGTMASTGALTMGGGTFGVLAPASGGSSQTVASLTTTASTNSIIRLTAGASGNTTLTIASGTPTTGAGSSVNFDYSSGSTMGGSVGNNSVVWNTTLTAGIIGGAYSVTDPGGTGFATKNGSNIVVRLTDPGGLGLPVNTGSATGSYFIGSGYSTGSTSTPGSLVQALSGALAASNVTVDTTGLASGANLDLGTNVLTLGAGLAINGANAYEITGSGAGGLRAATSGGTLYLNNGNSSTVTINAPILANGASGLTVNGTGTTILGGVNTHSGATSVNGGTLVLANQLALQNSTLTIGGGTASLVFDSSVAGNAFTFGGLAAGASVAGYNIVLQNNAAIPSAVSLTVGSNNATTTFAGNLIGGNSLTKVGTGTLTLSGTNTYSGGTVINGGTLQYNSDAALGASGSRNITFGGSGSLTWGFDSSSLGSLTVNSGAVGTLGSLNNLTFATTTGSGTIRGVGGQNKFVNLGDASTFTGNVALAYNANNTSGANTPHIRFSALNDAVGSSIQFYRQGGGTDSGQVGQIGLAGDAGSLTFDNRQIQLLPKTGGSGQSMATNWLLNNNGTASNAWVINTNLLNQYDRDSTLGLGGANAGGNAFNGVIGNSTFGGSFTTGTGVLSLRKEDAGRWILGSANSYTGATTIVAGTLEVTNLANGGSNSSIGASSNAASNLLLGNGATLRYTGSGQSSNRGFTINGTAAGHQATLDASGSGALNLTNTANPAYGTVDQTRTLNLTGISTANNTLAANIANNGTGAVSLNKTGIGTWVLSGQNGFAGGTSLSGGGTLVLDFGTQDNSKLSNTAALTLNGSSLVLKGGSHTEVVGSTSLSNFTGSRISRDGGTAQISLGAITTGTMSTLLISESSAAATTTANVNGILPLGRVVVGNHFAANDGTNNIVAFSGYNTATTAGGSSDTAIRQLTGGGTMAATLRGYAIRLVNDGDSNVLELGSRNLEVVNNSTLLYAGGGNNQYTINGTGALTSASTDQPFVINTYAGTTLTVNARIVGRNGNTTGIVKAGEGALVVGGANDTNITNGVSYIQQGVLRLANNTGLGATTAGTIVQAGAALELSQTTAETPANITVGAEALTLNGYGISNSGALRNHSGDNSWAGAITIGANGSRINSNAGTSLELTGGIATNIFQDVTFGGAGNTTVSTAAISGAGGLIKDGTGTLTLSNTNTYTGATNIAAGVLSFVSGSLGSTGNITFTGNSTLQWSDANTQDISSRIVMGNGVTSTFDTNGNDVSFAAALGNSGSGALAKLGAGTLTIAGTSTYTGATTVSGGMLAITGTGSINSSSGISVASGAHFKYNSSTALTTSLTLDAGATLSGSGTIHTSLTLSSLNNVLAPGNSPGIQTFGVDQIWESFTYEWELNDWVDSVVGTTDIDQIQITGGLTLSGTSYALNIFSLDALNAAGLVGANGGNLFTETSKSWTILTTTTGITGFNANAWTLNTNGFLDAETGNWSLASTGNDLVLSYTVIPEPKAALLGGLGILLLFRRRR